MQIDQQDRLPRLTTFMAECFWPGITRQQLLDAGDRSSHAADLLSEEGSSVRYLGALLVPSDEIALCFFDATSMDAAVRISEQAAIPFERIVEIVCLEPQSAAAQGAPDPPEPDKPTKGKK